MPTLSDEVEEGMLVTWFVVPGATVRAGDLIAEVQVEKVSEEVYAPADGHLVEILVAPGEVVPQGAPIAVLEAGVAAAVSRETASERTVPRPPHRSRRPRAGWRGSSGWTSSNVTGSGPGGRIVEADVRAVAQRGAGVAPVPRHTGDVEPLSPMRRTIATRLTAGLREAAQLTLTAEVDATGSCGGTGPAQRGMGAPGGLHRDGRSRVRARAPRPPPTWRSRWSEDGPRSRPSRSTSVWRCAVDDGLIVPVIRARRHQGHRTASTREIAELAERARSGRSPRPRPVGRPSASPTWEPTASMRSRRSSTSPRPQSSALAAPVRAQRS